MLRLFLFIIFSCVFFNMTYAQNIVIEETFDNNEMSWTENAKPSLGESIIMEGQMKFDTKNSSAFFSNKNLPTLLLSEGIMPIDPTKGFEISVDMEFDHIGAFGTTLDLLNYTSGILLEYDDDYNFIALALSEKTCYILFYKDGKLVRYKDAAIKMKGREKNKVLANLKVEYRDYKLKIYVDDIEMTEVRKVNIESPVVALFATGKRKVSFDNVIVRQ